LLYLPISPTWYWQMGGTSSRPVGAIIEIATCCFLASLR
jgi:hypothetical protein